MRFKDYFSLKQILFALLLFALLIPIAIWDSDTQVKVNFHADDVSIISDRYTMSIPYDIVASAQLVPLSDPGEKVEGGEGFDNDIIRTGIWTNDTWGEYTVLADLDTSNCILVRLKDDRAFVFSCKDDETTAKHFETLQTYLS